MSVTNGERLATKQDLADMYQGILPYLGGMPEIVANKFSKGDLYSTDEKMIGQWQDGRPLYQKYITFTGLDIGIITGAWTNISSVSDLDIRSLVSIEFPSLRTCPCFYRVNSGYLQYYSETKYNNYSNSSAIIRYTKTTDSAISIGSDTDYSTEEKIVGTWIDGKPIYQKTVYFGALPNKTVKTVSHGIDNLKNVIVIFGSATNGNGAYLTLPDADDSSQNSIRITATNSTINIGSITTDRSGWTGYVTIQYTKTT